MTKRRSRKKKKSPVNWIEIAVQFLTGLITGIILLIIDKLWKPQQVGGRKPFLDTRITQFVIIHNNENSNYSSNINNRRIYRAFCLQKMEGQEMPVGSPKPQTIATKKYEEKAGWISKSYKLKRELVERFAAACQSAGISQAAQLTKMMNEFIAQQKNE